MGLALFVVTSDGYLVFSRRSENRRIRTGEYDCSIVEGLKPIVNDYSIYDDDYLVNECKRAFEEEVCTHFDGSRTILHGVVLDRAYGQWNAIGTIETPLTSKEISHLHSVRNDTYEKNDLFMVPVLNGDTFESSNLRMCLKRFRRVGFWDMALTALYATLRYLGAADDDLAGLLE